MKVSELKKILERYSDDDIVLILNPDGDENDGSEYRRLEEIDLFIVDK